MDPTGSRLENTTQAVGCNNKTIQIHLIGPRHEGLLDPPAPSHFSHPDKRAKTDFLNTRSRVDYLVLI